MSTIPLISVVVAVYNGRVTLQQCIDSVASQTFNDVELIVIDGGSIDGTVDLLRANASKLAYWISEPDNGICSAWNKALSHARGEWICFLGADDFLWDSEVLLRCAEQLIMIPDRVRVVYGEVMLLDQNGGEVYKVGRAWDLIRNGFRHHMNIPHQGVMHRRSLFELHGGFDEKFKICGDYELLMRELLREDAVFLENIVVSGMRCGGVSSNPMSSLALLRELRVAQIKHGLHKPSWRWLVAIARVRVRLILWLLLGERRARLLLDFGRRLVGERPYWTRT